MSVIDLMGGAKPGHAPLMGGGILNAGVLKPAEKPPNGEGAGKKRGRALGSTAPDCFIVDQVQKVSESSKGDVVVLREARSGITIGSSVQPRKHRLYRPCRKCPPAPRISKPMVAAPKPAAVPTRPLTSQDEERLNALSLYLQNHFDNFEVKVSTLKKRLNEYLSNQSTRESLHWEQRYRPRSLKHFSTANSAACKELRQWVVEWPLRRTKESASSEDSDSSEWFEGQRLESKKKDLVKNGILIVGPPGCGKTVSISCIAHETNYTVVEVNSSESRTGVTLKKKILEATQSTSCKHTVVEKIIVIEEIDSVFAEDQGFLSALAEVLIDTKCPVVMTSNSTILPNDLRGLVDVVNLREPQVPELLCHAALICAAENIGFDLERMHNFVLHSRKDYRSVSNEVQIWGVENGASEPKGAGEGEMKSRGDTEAASADQEDSDGPQNTTERKEAFSIVNNGVRWDVDDEVSRIEKIVCLSSIAKLEKIRKESHKKRRRFLNYLEISPFFFPKAAIEFLNNLSV